MHECLTLNPISLVNGTINLPGSKSITNRALLLSAMSNSTTHLKNILYSQDTQYMLNTLKICGIKFNCSYTNLSCTIEGCNKPLNISHKTSLFLGNAGTAFRSLAAIFSLNNNNILLTGNKRMKQRPIKHLVQALQQGGAQITYSEQDQYPPIKIKGGFIGGNIFVSGKISSQFLSALLIATPLAQLDSTITVTEKLVSKPYIDITLNLISKFGIKIIHKDYTKFNVQGRQKYISPKEYSIEGDASSASYFLAAAAIKGGSVKVTGIGLNSIQGDVKFANVLKKMGAYITFGKDFIVCKKKDLIGIDLDMNDIPDAAMTIAIVALFSKGKTVIRNIYNWRVKETDRLSAMTNELKKIGAQVIEGNDYIEILPPINFVYAKINTYDDHRIAMCFALIALSGIKVTLLNYKCVNKTFPDYFQKLKSICSY
ncbi:3-phosphoshikimate 1-carboxyvinyltransferase [Buchnera aphidicola str. Bp (Baizongia pistaciae)]|uniref:3-phosphoshikimate 1-carboxyvinyltransferase n=1 Tax=Buchnera aphidicola subsp. Baizongia pistaciae (strain Bp) TaxID=224915 RepID=AROA_BUCBP|nr:3-phosphoshikimate 1-carboxyvinyltransferase [Buchnera aphidicola]P59416.1 RecName: Full=3-phosphoshikimate 1-carboxyvinyltransferase; AltName: Full=5-enolpyruvylshikimate-3-phosphate synthase; Short=EPSP synthase; Short=EPSPS [Buchnera aphidicola str. Bp (Baizongia pistaciae)]AAO27013.1 3-phosphoshikimate 1-carboxyvinyltransferase [Buchnera aphidicola str. Bp (Baizongia pistaciae)]